MSFESYGLPRQAHGREIIRVAAFRFRFVL